METKQHTLGIAVVEAFRNPQIDIERGWGNGYVLIPYGHPLYGLNYIHLESGVSVHGGLTYSGHRRQLQGLELIETREVDEMLGWAFGFDTAHCYDNPRSEDRDFVIAETMRLRDQLERVERVEINIIYKDGN